MALRTFPASDFQRPGEHGRTRAGNRAAQRARLQRAAAHRLEAGNELCALLFDDHVFERCANHVEIVGVTARNEAGEIGRLPDEVRHVHVGLENAARRLGRQEQVRMHQHGANAGRHRNLLHARMINAHGEHQAAEQTGRNVVDMQRAGRDLLALHGELQQLDLRQRLGQQRIGSNHRSHRRGRRTAEATAERNALVNRGREAEARIQRLLHAPAARGRRCFSPGSRGMSVTTPLAPVITTPGLSVRSTVTVSPSTSTENPRMSKPMATLAAEAGANAVALLQTHRRIRWSHHRCAPM